MHTTAGLVVVCLFNNLAFLVRLHLPGQAGAIARKRGWDKLL